MEALAMYIKKLPSLTGLLNRGKQRPAMCKLLTTINHRLSCLSAPTTQDLHITTLAQYLLLNLIDDPFAEFKVVPMETLGSNVRLYHKRLPDYIDFFGVYSIIVILSNIHCVCHGEQYKPRDCLLTKFTE